MGIIVCSSKTKLGNYQEAKYSGFVLGNKRFNIFSPGFTLNVAPNLDKVDLRYNLKEISIFKTNNYKPLNFGKSAKLSIGNTSGKGVYLKGKRIEIKGKTIKSVAYLAIKGGIAKPNAMIYTSSIYIDLKPETSLISDDRLKVNVAMFAPEFSLQSTGDARLHIKSGGNSTPNTIVSF